MPHFCFSLLHPLWLYFYPWYINHQQFWLLGYEFPATLLVFTTEMVYVVTTAKKGKRISLIGIRSFRLTTHSNF